MNSSPARETEPPSARIDAACDALPDPLPVEWEYVRARRRRGAEGSLHVRPLLIDAGVTMVQRKGLAALSLAACARAAGVSAGAPYSWFAGAAEFRGAIVAEFLRGIRGELDVWAGDGSTTATDAIADACRAIITEFAAIGLGFDDVFGPDDESAGKDLVWERNALRAALSDLVHRAIACPCPTTPATCPRVRAPLAATLAVCHGYAALTVITSGPDAVAATAEAGVRSVGVLVRELGRENVRR